MANDGQSPLYDSRSPNSSDCSPKRTGFRKSAEDRADHNTCLVDQLNLEKLVQTTQGGLEGRQGEDVGGAHIGNRR